MPETIPWKVRKTNRGTTPGNWRAPVTSRLKTLTSKRYTLSYQNFYLLLNLFMEKWARSVPTPAPRGTRPKQGPTKSYFVISMPKE